MNLSRRMFLGGLAGFAALGPRRIFAAAPGAFTCGRPNLVFGVVSDVHIAFVQGGKSLHRSYDTTHLEKAFAYFRDNGADAVVIAGDMAHHGLVGELQAVAATWYRVFPDDRASDGRRVERVFVFGNHDWSGIKRGKAVFGTDEKAVIANALRTDPKRFWDACFHEEWKEFYTKTVKGYRFVGANWCKGLAATGDCNGVREEFIAGLADRYATIAGEIDPNLPFFHVQHPHPRGTVHGDVWGQDDGQSVSVLSAYPNAISFSGHSLTTLLDDKAVWQGGFTAVGTATLRNVGSSGLSSGVAAGFENDRTPKSAKGADALKVMPEIDRYAAKQGQLVRVYDDRIVFSRRDFAADAPLSDDLVMPLPAKDAKPFAFESRRAAAKAPRFAAGAALAFASVTAKRRGAKKTDPGVPSVEIVIPAANAEPSARGVRFGIVATGADGRRLELSLLHDAFRFSAADARANAPAKCRVALDRLPAGDVTFEVRAYSFWEKASEPLAGVFRRGDLT